jgi:hypothetical protein
MRRLWGMRGCWPKFLLGLLTSRRNSWRAKIFCVRWHFGALLKTNAMQEGRGETTSGPACGSFRRIPLPHPPHTSSFSPQPSSGDRATKCIEIYGTLWPEYRRSSFRGETKPQTGDGDHGGIFGPERLEVTFCLTELGRARFCFAFFQRCCSFGASGPNVSPTNSRSNSREIFSLFAVESEENRSITSDFLHAFSCVTFVSANGHAAYLRGPRLIGCAPVVAPTLTLPLSTRGGDKRE